jgi:hypothetical protein
LYPSPVLPTLAMCSIFLYSVSLMIGVCLRLQRV